MTRPGFVDAFAELSAALETPADAVLTLPLDLIDEDPSNPRQVFDEGELAALAETLATRGLKQPIVVTPAAGDGRYRVRYGARRLRAARLAGFTEVRAVVEAGVLNAADALTDQLIENEQRASLTTADMARAVTRLLELGQSQADIARRLGRGKELISLYAAIADMPAPLQDLAAVLGPRTVYELWRAWQAQADQTQQWLAGREPSQITQAEARALAARLRPSSQRRAARSTQVSTGAASAPARSALLPPPSALSQSKSTPSTAGAGRPCVLVTVAGRNGRLMLGRSSSAAGLWIAFDEGGEETIAACDVQLVEVQAGKGEGEGGQV